MYKINSTLSHFNAHLQREAWEIVLSNQEEIFDTISC